MTGIAEEFDAVKQHIKNGTKPDNYLERWKQILVECWELQDQINSEDNSLKFADLMILANEYSKLVPKETALKLATGWRMEYKKS